MKISDSGIQKSMVLISNPSNVYLVWVPILQKRYKTGGVYKKKHLFDKSSQNLLG